MRRLLSNRGREILYDPGDKVKLVGSKDMERIPCTVVYPMEYVQEIIHGKQQSVGKYTVRLGDGTQIKVPREQVWKEADTGEMGRVRHL